MASTTQPAGKKRKITYDTNATPARVQKRQKSRDAREIPSQTTHAAMSATGELNIASFIKSREYEINALDRSMKKSREALMTRAFQQVPRHMRRRTASHNVKKVPRRLRRRATREMKEDNTPTVSGRTRTPSSRLRLRLETSKAIKLMNIKKKILREKKKEAKTNAQHLDPEKHISTARIPRIKKNQLEEPPRATSKFKRRQVHKTWLPTHLWHAKRAHMTRPTEPLWRMAIPISPSEKSYRPTHRATGSRGCVAWDTSYMSTVGCLGTDLAVEGLLKSLGFPGEGWSGARYKKWKAGTRSADGWISERDHLERPISPIVVVWRQEERGSDGGPQNGIKSHLPDQSTTRQTKPRQLNRQILIRIHPSAFHMFWIELLKVAKMQKPQVLIEDLRFEIGSIEIVGPASTEALSAVLKPVGEEEQLCKTWSELAGLSNPSLLPLNALLSFHMEDPRLHHPPKLSRPPRDEESIATLNELLISWCPDSWYHPSSLFSHKSRWRSSQALLSQKGLNRLRNLALPGQAIDVSNKSPRIPVILMAQRAPSKDSSLQGKWTILTPWKCIDPIWRSLMYCPLSSGSTPRFGGLDEIRQLNFEQASPWFPGDMPGTEAGKAWERTESQTRFDEWIRRPPSRRYAWDTLDLGLGRKGEVGRGWACDWEFLIQGGPATKAPTRASTGLHAQSRITSQPLLTQRQRKEAKARLQSTKEDDERRRNTSSPESETSELGPIQVPEYSQISGFAASKLLQAPSTKDMPERAALVTVRITLLTRGTPNTAARIYRLPKAASKIDANPSTGTGPPPQAEAQKSASTNRKRATLSLRSRWLALDSRSATPNPNSATCLPNHLPKVKQNHHSLPRQHRTYKPESLAYIRVFPKDAPKKITEMYGPPPPPKSSAQILADLIPQPVAGQEPLWDEHVPCPDAEDLIGFVTSGGYNLSQGKGTAIGGLWLQKVAQGWSEEQTSGEHDAMNTNDTTQESSVTDGTRSTTDGKTHRKIEPQHKNKNNTLLKKQVDRERHLCIVRNAGESVGRLGIWEICL